MLYNVSELVCGRTLGPQGPEPQGLGPQGLCRGGSRILERRVLFQD